MNTPQILEDLRATAEKFLSIYPEICALVAAQPVVNQPVEEAPYQPTIESEEHRINKLLQKLGAPLHVKGYRYLSVAIQMVSLNPELLFAITKELYPAVAKVYDIPPSRVERAMRHAINKMADKCNDFYAKSFDDQPTNSEFLAWCVETLKWQ